jgi:hypothetical protein
LIVRATITHRVEDGLLPSTKRYYVDCTVLFSEEEQAIIRARGLGSHYIVTDPEMPPPRAGTGTVGRLLIAVSPLVFVGGCVAGIGMTFAGRNHAADSTAGFCFFAALALFLGGFALKRHVRVAEQPQQTITLSRLLTNPSFFVYAVDNARAKAVDVELRDTLARLKEGLLVNRDIVAAETFEL